MIFTLSALLSILFAGLVLVVVYFIASKFIQGSILQIIGLILLVIFFIVALQALGIAV